MRLDEIKELFDKLDLFPTLDSIGILLPYTNDESITTVFNTVVADLQAGDIFVVCKMDRFCRSVREGLSIIEVLMGKGVTVHILNLGLIDDSSIGRLLFTVLLAFAEFERNMIVERTKLGREVARQKDGYKEGRPPKFSKEKINLAMELLNTHSYKQVENMTGISKSTLQRAKKNQEK